MNTEIVSHPSAPSKGRMVELRGNYRRTYSDFNALDRALVAGDLEAARRAFARLQEDSPRIADALSHDPFPAENRPLRALKELGHSLLTGDLGGATQAFQRFH